MGGLVAPEKMFVNGSHVGLSRALGSGAQDGEAVVNFLTSPEPNGTKPRFVGSFRIHLDFWLPLKNHQVPSKTDPAIHNLPMAPDRGVPEEVDLAGTLPTMLVKVLVSLGKLLNLEAIPVPIPVLIPIPIPVLLSLVLG